MALAAADTAEVDEIAYLLFSGFTDLVSAFPHSPLGSYRRCPRLPLLRRCSLLDAAQEGEKEVARGSLHLGINKMFS